MQRAREHATCTYILTSVHAITRTKSTITCALCLVSPNSIERSACTQKHNESKCQDTYKHFNAAYLTPNIHPQAVNMLQPPRLSKYQYSAHTQYQVLKSPSEQPN